MSLVFDDGEWADLIEPEAQHMLAAAVDLTLDAGQPGLVPAIEPALLLVPDVALFQLDATGEQPPLGDHVFTVTRDDGRVVHVYVAPDALLEQLGVPL